MESINHVTRTAKKGNEQSLFKGRRICLLAPFPPRKGGVTVQTDLLERSLLKDGAQIFRVDTNIQKLRIPVIGLPVRLAVQPWLVAIRLLRQLRKCEVVHIQAAANWGFMPAVIGVPICRLFRKRCVLSFHSGIGPVFMDRFPWLVKPVFCNATVATVCSIELQQAFEERGVKTELFYNLFDSDIFRFRDRDRFEPKLAWTRSLEELYDPLVALRVYELVLERYPSATMVMAGDGSLTLAVRKYVHERGLTGVTLTGRILTEDVARVLDNSDICLNTSKADGLPTTMLEAAASGTAIVTTAVGGIRSLFADGVSAMMGEAGDAQGLADGVIRVLENPDRSRQICAAASEVALRYTWSSAARPLAEAYGFVGDNGHTDMR